MKKAMLILWVMMITGTYAYSQEADPKEVFLDGEYFMMYEEFADALPFYLQLYEKDPENTNICYRIGVCYLNLPGQKDKSIPFLEKAILNTTVNYQEGKFTERRAPLDAYYFLGTAYRINNELDKALDTYTKYRENIDPRDTVNIKFVDQQIFACRNAGMMKEKPVYFDKVNLGDMINDNYKNFNPILSADEKKLVFVSGLKFYDAIFYSMKVDGKWTNPLNLTPQVKSDGDLYPTGLSARGDVLFMARKMDINSDIYQSRHEGLEWTPAVELNKNINTKYWESHACLSADARSLYFVSNKPGGYGGFDIYVSHWDEKTNDWGKAINLGPMINTTFNEETPFITADNKTLYFSSQGHRTMGGYDIFYSILDENNQWNEPVNIGYPLNTTDDDLFFFPVADGISGYKAIYSADGYGDDDIYRIDIFSDRNPRDVNIRGLVSLKDKTSVAGQSITVEIMDSQGKSLVVREPDPSSGAVVYNTKTPGTYRMHVTSPGYKEAVLPFVIPDDYSLAEVVVKTMLEPLEVAVKEIFLPAAVFFEFDKSSLTTAEYQKLDILAGIMNNQSDLVVELAGYTDSRGSEGYNKRLSERRAREVFNYLAGKDITKERMNIKGYGEASPVAINQNINGSDNPEGRRLNRRVEIHIIRTQNPLIKSETITVPDALKVK